MNITDISVYKEYLALRIEVDRHKWFESEKAGKDVGFLWALIDWTVKFKTKWILSREKNYNNLSTALSHLSRTS